MGNLIAMVFQTQPSTFKYWCGSAIPFCLFSEGQASTLRDAQEGCKEISGLSYPPEITDEYIYDVFSEYIQNHSISNVILNSMKRDDVWVWINAGTDSTTTETIVESGEMLVYSKDVFDPVFWLVCMTECQYVWKDFPNKRANKVKSLTDDFVKVQGTDECKEMCEKKDECSSINVEDGEAELECDLLGYPYNKRMEKFDGSHHWIDRSARTREKCIGNYAGKKKFDLYGNLDPVMLLLGLGMLIFMLVFLLMCFSLCDNAFKSYTTESSATSSQ